MKWTTVGFRQANSMGGGEAAIPKSGKFRVFVLMGQSNMHGLARTTELTAPYLKNTITAKKRANEPPENDKELLRVLVSHLEDNPSPEARKRLGRRPHILTVILAQNRAGREILNVTTVNHYLMIVDRVKTQEIFHE